MYNKSQNSPYAWWMLCIILLMSIAAPLNQFKVPPMMQALSHDLDISLAMVGWLMSIFSVVAIFLAIPLGFSLQKIGIKRAGIIALLSLITGSMLGYYANSPTTLLASRLIEGLGMCLIAIVGPAALSFWFTPEKLGSAMGIWGSWVPLGLVIMFNFAPHIGVESWQPVWFFTTLYTLFVLVLFVVCFTIPDKVQDSLSNNEKVGSFSSIVNKIKKQDIWLLACVFLTYNVCQMSMNSFMPSFMQQNLHMSSTAAGFTSSLLMFMSIASGALAGIWSDKIQSRKIPTLLAMLGLVVCMFFPFSLPANMMTAFMLIVGFFIGIVPVCVFAAAPEIMGNAKDAGLGLSIVAVGQNMGMFIGSGFYGTLIENIGWVHTGYAITPVLCLGIIAAYKMKIS